MSEHSLPDSDTVVQQANRCIVNSRDCEEAEKYLEIAIELAENDNNSGTSEHHTARQGLVLAAMVSYARAFTKSYSDGRAAALVTVDVAQVLAERTELVELHNTVMERRNKAGAHSDWEFRKSERVEMEDIEGVLRRNSIVDYQERIDLNSFHDLAKRMKEHFRWEGFARDKRLDRRQGKRHPTS